MTRKTWLRINKFFKFSWIDNIIKITIGVTGYAIGVIYYFIFILKYFNSKPIF